MSHNAKLTQIELVVRVLSGLFGLILGLLSAFSFSYKSPEYFPRIEIEAGIELPNNISYPPGSDVIKLAFLFDARPTLMACEGLIGNVARTSLAKCNTCVVRRFECLSPLPEAYQEQLSEQAIDSASGRMANGVVIFTAAIPEIAMATCQESQRQSIGSASQITCFAANLPRPRVASAVGEMDIASLTRIFAGVLAASIAIVLIFFATSGKSLLTLIQRHAVALPAYLTSLPRSRKRAVMLSIDLIALVFSLWLAFAVRHGNLSFNFENVWLLFLIVPVVAVPIFIRMGLYSAVVRYLGQRALMAIAQAVGIYSLALAVAGFILSIKGVPISVYVLNGLICVVLIGTPRLIARDWLMRSKMGWSLKTSSRKPVAIYGAGSAGIQLALALGSSREMRVAAFFDDDPQLQGRQIAGINVYSPSQLVEVVRVTKARDVLLAIPSVSKQRRHEIIRQLEQEPLRVLTLPALADLADGKVQVADLREVDLADLLGRDAVTPHPDLLRRNIDGKAVMVTGAGGSIGSELCRQICTLGATTLVLYEISEFNLYAIEAELLQIPNHPLVVPILGSVQDQPRLERTLRKFLIATIFHAAAYKHVPMVEKNPAQGVLNNIFGTLYASYAAVSCGVETFVLISTDKAVRPTNTMGTTKRVAEMILQAMQTRHGNATRFTMVRFGNVLGSSGSVIPLFRQQIKDGGPVTVTDPAITRYFMTIPEAAELVIQAGAMGTGGDVFVLDMGEPVRILDLAHRMIKLSGMSLRDMEKPDGDIEVVFTGLRPGEKLYEELLIGDNVSATVHPRVKRANEAKPSWEELQLLLEGLKDACELNATARIRELLVGAVREFDPQCGNEDMLADR